MMICIFLEQADLIFFLPSIIKSFRILIFIYQFRKYCLELFEYYPYRSENIYQFQIILGATSSIENRMDSVLELDLECEVDMFLRLIFITR
jgi:hypothetical protein